MNDEMNEHNLTHKYAMRPVLEQITNLHFRTFDGIGLIEVFILRPNQTEPQWFKTFDLCKTCGDTLYRCGCHCLQANFDCAPDSDEDYWDYCERDPYEYYQDDSDYYD
jgi:hypothetical protein